MQRLPVGLGLNGAELDLFVHVIRGAAPGPTLLILSTLHGGEWYSILALRTLLGTIDVATLHGTLIVVPVGNPPALLSQTRNALDESDSPDLNRIFPGRLTRLSDQLATVLSRDVLPHATHLIDLHSCPWGSAALEVLIGDKYTRAALASDSQRFALALGMPALRKIDVLGGHVGLGSSLGYAGEVLGIPSVIVEIGGAGFGPRLDRAWQQATIDGLMAGMRSIGMIDGPPAALPPRQLVCRRLHHAHPKRGGLLVPRLPADALGNEVPRETLLAEVVSPYTNEIIEELRAPVNGLLTYVARGYAVRPGDWAFGIADAEDEASFWIENADGSRHAT